MTSVVVPFGQKEGSILSLRHLKDVLSFSRLFSFTITYIMGKLCLPCTFYYKYIMRSAPEARGSPSISDHFMGVKMEGNPWDHFF